MKRQAIVLVTAVGRAAARRMTVGVWTTALLVVLSLGGCWSSHDRLAHREPDAGPDWIVNDAGSGPTDAGALYPDACSCDSGPDDDVDGDGFPASVDCDDNDAAIHPGAVELGCGFDGVDQNCDGFDIGEECEADPECLAWLCNG